MSHRIHCDRCDLIVYRDGQPDDFVEYQRLDIQPQKGLSLNGNAWTVHLCNECYMEFQRKSFKVWPLPVERR